jgi:gliding motility-associated protein GldM
MINLMYLVLTALLALNVSNEILNAFKIINRSISQSAKVMETKNKGSLLTFTEALTDDKYTEKKKERIKIAIEWAKQVDTISKSLISKLGKYREEIITESGGYMIDDHGKQVMKSPENIDAATHYMVEGPKNGAKMQKELEEYKNKIAMFVPLGNDPILPTTRNDTIYRELPMDLTVDKTDENPTADWSYGNFHHVPVIGAATIVDKFATDVQNSESIVLDNLWTWATGEKEHIMHLVFDKYIPVISAPNTYLLPGEKYTAEVRIAAYSEKNNTAHITVNGQNYPIIDGVAKYSAVATKEGENKVVIAGNYIDPNKNEGKGGVENLAPITTSFFVGQPQASVSLDKMNVFYIGVPNPITISASGIPLDKLTFTAEGLSITKSGTVPGEYSVTPTLTKPGMASIALNGKRGDGTNQDFGIKKYRVKEIPNPIILLGNKQSGRLEASRARLELGPEARLENFDFDARFNVVSFKVTISRAKGGGDLEEYPVKGPLFSNGINGTEAAIKKLAPKDRLWLEDIRVVGPDKKLRSIPTISYILF